MHFANAYELVQIIISYNYTEFIFLLIVFLRLAAFLFQAHCSQAHEPFSKNLLNKKAMNFNHSLVLCFIIINIPYHHVIVKITSFKTTYIINSTCFRNLSVINNTPFNTVFHTISFLNNIVLQLMTLSL